MKRYLAFICGHYLPIGFEELYACLEAENVDYRIVRKDEQILIFETEKNPEFAVSRCAFLHSLILLTDIVTIDDKNLEYESVSNELDLESDKTFAARIRRIGKKEIDFETIKLERKLGSYVYNKYVSLDLQVDLKSPDYLFLGILLKNELFLGLELWSQDRKNYAFREPGEREYFRPGAMRTDFARAIVNLSRIRKGEVLFDPFCGGGGFLLEASEIGVFSIGSDLDAFAVRGTKENLEQFNSYNTSIYRGDSRFMALKKVDAISTDPPYSTQSSTHGEVLSNLIYEFLIEARKVLKSEGYLVFSTPDTISPETIVEKTDFKLVTLIDCIIHKSLTRRILVLK